MAYPDVSTVMTSTYVDGRSVSTLVDASPTALLPGQFAELADHVEEKLADDRLVGRTDEVEGGPPVRPGQRQVVRADPAALTGHVQPDHPPVLRVAAALHVPLAHQRVDHRGQRAGRRPSPGRHVA